jgi:CYTH domain-containing protein
VATEIERKFIADQFRADRVGPGFAIRQGYIAEEGDAEVRVRITEQASSLTVKVGHGRSRTEVEVDISRADAEQLWGHTAGRRIDKVRHHVDIEGIGVGEVTVDVYGDALAGLVVVEAEFETETAADSFVPPAWFGREVTGDSRWSNAALARHGRPAET